MPVPSFLAQVRVFEPGRDISAAVTGAAVSIKRLVKIAGNRDSDGNLTVTTCGAGDRAFGVAAADGDVGQLIHVARDGIVKIVAAGAIPAGSEVQAAAGGAVAVKSTGTTVGFAITGAADTEDAQIALI